MSLNKKITILTDMGSNILSMQNKACTPCVRSANETRGGRGLIQNYAELFSFWRTAHSAKLCIRSNQKGLDHQGWAASESSSQHKLCVHTLPSPFQRAVGGACEELCLKASGLQSIHQSVETEPLCSPNVYIEGEKAYFQSSQRRKVVWTLCKALVSCTAD